MIIAALGAHVAVNALNEYEDFRSGLDFTTRRTPFSGGSGTLVAHGSFAPATLCIAMVALLITALIGLYFVWQLGSALVVPGLIGLAIIVAYTRWINRFPLMCLFAPGIGFGLLLVNLAVLVLTGTIPVESLWASGLVTLLTSNLLLVNQLPDREADRQVGRRHVAIVWGEARAGRIVALLLAGAYGCVLAGWLSGGLPAASMLAWGTVPLALFVATRALTLHRQTVDALTVMMGVNVVITLLTPVLMAVGLLWGAEAVSRFHRNHRARSCCRDRTAAAFPG